MAKLCWKRDYGDGYETDDSVLWINGEPTDTVISGINSCCFAYVDGVEIGVYDTRKEAKAAIMEEKNNG